MADILKKRYALILLDTRGQNMKRISFYAYHFFLCIIGVSMVISLVLATFLLGFNKRKQMTELQALQEENRSLTKQLESMQMTLPAVQALVEQLDNTFLVLVYKSGLGIKTHNDADNSNIEHLKLTLKRENQIEWLNLDTVLANQQVLTLKSRAKELLYRLGETVDYFRDAEHRLNYTPSVRPVYKGPLTSGFGRRVHPIHGYMVMHKGLDIGGQTGDIIIAPADGVVIWTGYRGGYGKTVVLDHGFGLQTHYAHLNGYRVEVGQEVHRNQNIAEMGSTGRSTGPHLHYEVRQNGRPLDPLPFLLD